MYPYIHISYFYKKKIKIIKNSNNIGTMRFNPDTKIK
jgi:hypothetical protein